MMDKPLVDIYGGTGSFVGDEFVPYGPKLPIPAGLEPKVERPAPPVPQVAPATADEQVIMAGSAEAVVAAVHENRIAAARALELEGEGQKRKGLTDSLTALVSA